MTNERNALKAGLFIIASIAAAGFIVVSVKGTLHSADPSEVRHVTFKLGDNLSGLNKGDELRLGGYKVGIVKDIYVATENTPDGEPRILVSFSMPARYKLHADTRIVVDSSLTGVPNLNIERLGSGAEVTHVEGQPSALTDLFNVVGGAAPEVADIIHNVKTVTLPRVDSATDHASEAMLQIRNVLGDTNPDIRGTLAGLHSTMNTVRDKLPGILDEAKIDLQEVHTTIDHAQNALSDLTTTLANAKDITTSARTLLITNRSKINSIIRSLKAAGDNLNGASVEIRQSPWRLLYRPSPDEMGNLNLYDAARQFAEGASSLDDASTALHDCILDKSADPAAVRVLMKQLDDSFANFKLVEDKLWTQVK